MDYQIEIIIRHQAKLKRCDLCPDMAKPVIIGNPIKSKVLLVGQAPGSKEIELQKPFAWTAGKTLFKWFDSIGIAEADFRRNVYMAAVCRCFPGKNPKGGDRVPCKDEIEKCAGWLDMEIDMLKPELIIPVGKLAISQFMELDKLEEVVGRKHKTKINGKNIDLVPLPHPSGASTWHRTSPGKLLLEDSLKQIKHHSTWRNIMRNIRRP